MVRSIDSKEARMLVDMGKVLILDVRTPYENADARIKNSILIPLNELESRLGEIPKDRPILVYCRSGSRSLYAANLLEKHGFRDVLNLKEGIINCPFECLD